MRYEITSICDGIADTTIVYSEQEFRDHLTTLGGYDGDIILHPSGEVASVNTLMEELYPEGEVKLIICDDFVNIVVTNSTRSTQLAEGIVKLKSEDSGQALIAHLGGDGDFPEVRLVNWEENKEHTFMRSIEGKRVRVVLEVLD